MKILSEIPSGFSRYPDLGFAWLVIPAKAGIHFPSATGEEF